MVPTVSDGTWVDPGAVDDWVDDCEVMGGMSRVGMFIRCGLGMADVVLKRTDTSGALAVLLRAGAMAHSRRASEWSG